MSKIGQLGFSLLELAISLVILGLVLSAALPTLGMQREIAARQEAERQLEQIRDSLLGFAISFGRLPCPATPNGAAQELLGREDCSREHGVLPWASLGIPENDPWGQRFTYYASNRFTQAVPEGQNASFTLDTLGSARIKPSRDSGSDLADSLPLVVVCHGARSAGAWRGSLNLTGASGDEAENADADLVFVYRDSATDFDDQLLWISATILKNRLLTAGKLP